MILYFVNIKVTLCDLCEVINHENLPLQNVSIYINLQQNHLINECARNNPAMIPE
jgi:hypothetical protein